LTNGPLSYINFHSGSVAELASERNFQISSEKNEEGEDILKLSLSPTDEFFAAGSRGRRCHGDNMEIAVETNSATNPSTARMRYNVFVRYY
jgi:hypothetical protein